MQCGQMKCKRRKLVNHENFTYWIACPGNFYSFSIEGQGSVRFCWSVSVQPVFQLDQLIRFPPALQHHNQKESILGLALA
ncbi:guanine nucleotide-binding protein G(I)/G(S)/G(O) subunit gamma-7 isoform X1 [Carcharodon carcharias]|uniref:guanine nucleotide-binding protein G(I)/G(S)/G(O) subunit gamma-7 isoform X1 n=1 Tax=Carcharodon carcharias TaxID=13397 RepID=UPI001B7ECB8B|nr:guanine nucleotide-binding protein G(I)/G(S)/G(O) subunit gamma-7 isoform X1 [Carcharodon carcharias]